MPSVQIKGLRARALYPAQQIGEPATLQFEVDRISGPGGNAIGDVDFRVRKAQQQAGGSLPFLVEKVQVFDSMRNEIPIGNASDSLSDFETAWAKGADAQRNFTYTFTLQSAPQTGGRKKKTRKSKRSQRKRKNRTRKH